MHLEWQPLSPDAKGLIDHILEKYFHKIKTYLKDTYGPVLADNRRDVGLLGDFDTYLERQQEHDTIRIRRRNLRLADMMLMPEVTVNEEANDRKIIYRALSLQYTVMSAIMHRVPYHAKMGNIGDFFMEEPYLHLRERTCEYLEWVLQLLGNFSLMGEELFVKLFNYFWR